MIADTSQTMHSTHNAHHTQYTSHTIYITHNTHHTQYTTHTIHRHTQYTDTHNTQTHTIHRHTQYTDTHNTQTHTIHMQTFFHFLSLCFLFFYSALKIQEANLITNNHSHYNTMICKLITLIKFAF